MSTGPAPPTPPAPLPEEPGVLGREPTLIVYSLLAALNAVQWAAISTPTWVHILVLAVTAGLAAFVNRAAVVPVAKVNRSIARGLVK